MVTQCFRFKLVSPPGFGARDSYLVEEMRFRDSDFDFCFMIGRARLLWGKMSEFVGTIVTDKSELAQSYRRKATVDSM